MKREGGSRAGKRRGPLVIDDLERTTPLIRGLVVFIFLFLVLCILVPELVFQGKIFLSPDSKAWFSFASVGREALEEGTYPLWNPYIFCGMPSYPTQAYTPFVYPVGFITHVLHRYLAFPEMTWLLVHYLLAGVGTYLLLRSLGVRAAVSLLCGALFMIMPNYIAAGAHGHGSQASAVAYLPLALLCASYIVRGRHRVAMTSLLAVVLGFQMLRGHIQIAYYSFLIVGLLFCFDAVIRLRRGEYRTVLGNIACGAIAFAAALGIAAVLVFPVRSYAAFSIRGAGSGGGLDYGYATGWSLHPKEMLSFIFPWAFGFGKDTYTGEMPFTDYPNFLGIVTVVFAAFGCFTVRTRWKWFFLLITVLSTLVSFGKFFPVLYGPMFRLLPYFNKFRVPVMVLIVQQLAVVSLAGLGIDEFLRRSSTGTLDHRLSAKRLKWLFLGSAVILILVLLGGDGIGNRFAETLTSRSAARGRPIGSELARLGADAFTLDLVRTLLVFVVVIGAAFLVAARKLKANAVFLVIAVAALFDMITVDHSVLHPEAVWKSDELRLISDRRKLDEFMKPDAVASFLMQDESLFRIFPVPDPRRIGQWSHNVYPFSENRFMISRIFSLGGYHAAKLKNYQQVMDVMFESFNRGRIPAGLLNMLNAKYYVSSMPLWPDDRSPLSIAWQEGSIRIYENNQALPRAFLVDSIRVVPSEAALRTLASTEFDPARVALMERRPDVEPVSIEGSSVAIAEYGLNEIALRARIVQPCLLVLSEIAYPDWRAEIDGREVEILTANYCLRALPLTAGEHEIRFTFYSDVLRRSLVISLAVFAVVVAVPFVHRLILGRRG